MSAGRKSKNHHWWPVALQCYWADRVGDVSWIGPTGEVSNKRAVNRKIGSKRYGHTIFRDSLWENHFENEFDVDNEIHTIIGELNALKPFGRTPSEFFVLMKRLFNKGRSLRDMCKFYHLNERLHRNILLLMYSLLIRSPANRFRYESYPKMIGLPADEEVGKGNMLQSYRIAKKLCQTGQITNQYFVILHSPLKRFIYGDGSLDWLTSGLFANRVDGRTLIPLTPHLCVYFCTPRSMRSTPNCASLSAAPWMVDRVNEITQIYAKDKLFFLGKAPKLTDAYRRSQFLEHKEKTDVLIDMLDEVAGIRKGMGLMTFDGFGVR